jgi:hypothetical protein
MYALRKVRVSILFVVVLLAVGVIAEAQQPKKVLRIGFYRRPIQLLTPDSREFGWLCTTLAT